MNDEDLISFAQYCLDTFMGHEVSDDLIRHRLNNWRHDMNLENNTSSEPSTAAQASPSRQSLESEMDEILVSMVSKMMRRKAIDEAKAALLKTVNMYVEERECKARIDEARLSKQVVDEHYEDSKHFYDRDHVLRVLSHGFLGRRHYLEKALRQQVKGGE